MDELTCALRDLDRTSDPIKRHFALQNIVTESYGLRANLKMRKLCEHTGARHVSEFGPIAEAFKAKWGLIPLVRTFRCLATLLAEDGKFDEAIRVCESAIDFGAPDETTSGFEGRIRRIRAQQEAHASAGQLPLPKPTLRQVKPEDVRAAHSTVPRFKEYFGTTEKMNRAQRRFYDEWKRAWESGVVTPVDGNISYLFCYVYRLFRRGAVTPVPSDGTQPGIRTIHNRAVPNLIKELDKLVRAYIETEPRFVIYCRRWMSDCFALQGDLSKALDVYPPPEVGGRHSAECDRILSLKLATGQRIDGRDVLTLQAPHLTKWGRDHVDLVLKHCFALTEAANRESDTNLLEAWTKNAHSDRMKVLCGAGSQRKTDVALYSFSDRPAVHSFVRKIARDSENAARSELGLPPVRERRRRA